MPDTKLRPTIKDSAMWTPQIVIHIWISFEKKISYTSEKNQE